MKNTSYINPESDMAVKYSSTNPIVKHLINKYSNIFYLLLEEIKKEEIKNLIEIGAGEGYWSAKLAAFFPNSKLISSDISNIEYPIRKEYLKKYTNVLVKQDDATKLKYKENEFDLVICLEVLEHIPNAEKALSEIFRINKKFGLFSVPNEPIWSIMNLARGKYLTRFGSTPDHINAWTPKKFAQLLKKTGYRIRYIHTPLPWTFILVEK
ncbi:class I SAM-dependent methyltransferase [Candidatus Dojkabacteria bacterium]|uniref:Class I SAM-dependent methyltransferase n=1 Tax=Candidatus Dojkabacteria bacterium TaxID=2099670 RepID=A0A847VDD5_9BACT|nr:class I SAM-dependent methyltransferase [Candidatus Dojkabacteria bacterium]